MIKAVLFDLDGVITDTAKFHYLAWKKLANDLGGDISEEFNECLKGVDRQESLKRILNEININLNEKEFEECLILKNQNYLESLNDLGEKDILSGIKKLFIELKNNDIKIIIASASKNAPYILEKLNLTQFVDDIADPNDVENNKPAPDIFNLAQRLSGVVKDLCVGVEDSQAGIDALNKAEIKSIAIGTNLNNATIKLKDTSELTFDVIKNLK